MKLLSLDESLSLRSGCFLFMMLISIFNILISSDDLFFSSSLIWASVSNKDWSFAICWLISFNRSWCSSSKLEATCNNLKKFLHNTCHYFDASNKPMIWFLNYNLIDISKKGWSIFVAQKMAELWFLGLLNLSNYLWQVIFAGNDKYSRKRIVESCKSYLILLKTRMAKICWSTVAWFKATFCFTKIYICFES